MGKEIKKISDLIPDGHNYNKGTEFGAALIEKSIRTLGAGRSILLDKKGRVIAGNKTLEGIVQAGFDDEDIIVVKTNGKQIVAVQRTDLDLDTKRGKEMALADNATGKANLAWDYEAMKDDFSGAELEEWGVFNEIGDDISPGEYGEDFSLPFGDKSPFQQMTFTLADEQAEQIKNAISDVKQTEEYKYVETLGNENTNGNALYLIITQWAAQRK